MEWLKEKLRGTAIHGFMQALRALYGQRNAVYDQQTIQVMRTILAPSSSCVDVGAHRGELLRHMVRIAPSGRHHAFEPLPHLASVLRQRFPQVIVHQIALGDFHGHSDFHHVTNATGYSGLKRRLYDRPDPIVSIISVEVSTLDECIGEDEYIALIKIDVEGGEFHVLKGARRVLNQCRPVVIFEASPRSTGQYGVTPDDVFAFLTAHGNYELTTMQRWLEKETPYTRQGFENDWMFEREYYYLAVPRERGV